MYSGAKLEIVDRSVANGLQYRYILVAVDAAGNRLGWDRGRREPEGVAARLAEGGCRPPRPPCSRWKRVAGASYYNVQLWRDGVKLFSSWPITNKLQLKRRWTYQGRRFVLTPGTYRWYVWPGSARGRAYGSILGRQTFTLTR